MDNVIAEEEFRANPWGDGLTVDEFYDLVLKATGSRKQARFRAKVRRAVIAQSSAPPP